MNDLDFTAWPWPYAAIIGASWGICSWLAAGRTGWSWWELPGVVAHELAHWLTALVCGGSPRSLSLIPRRLSDGSYALGSVTFHPRWFNGAVIALAPLWFIPLVSAAIVYWVVPDLLLWQQFAALALIGAALRGLLPSRTDWLIALRYPVGLLAAIGFAVLWYRP